MDNPMNYQLIAISDIVLSKKHPRNFFDNDRLEELARSMQSKGVLQSLIVKPAMFKNKYVLIAGERRLQAAKIAGLTNVPVCIISASDRECFELSLVENIQREDLTPIEEAEAFKEWLKDADAHLQLPKEFKSYEEWLAHKLGVSISFINSRLALLKLPQKIKDMVDEGTVPVSKVPFINTFERTEAKIAVAEIIEKFPNTNTDKLKKNIFNSIGGTVDLFSEKTTKGTPYHENHASDEIHLFLKKINGLSNQRFESWNVIKQYIPPSKRDGAFHVIISLIIDLGAILSDATRDNAGKNHIFIESDIDCFCELISELMPLIIQHFPDEYQKSQKRQEAQKQKEERKRTENLIVLKA
ncbi:MAG: ParB/RepB/Spo0J family partition protein [Patescibacteria group bacterium]